MTYEELIQLSPNEILRFLKNNNVIYRHRKYGDFLHVLYKNIYGVLSMSNIDPIDIVKEYSNELLKYDHVETYFNNDSFKLTDYNYMLLVNNKKIYLPEITNIIGRGDLRGFNDIVEMNIRFKNNVECIPFGTKFPSKLEKLRLFNINKISDRLFRRHAFLEVFESDAITIGANSFYHCDKLNIVDIPNALYIDDEAFHFCKVLDKCNMPKVLTIKNNAFDYCYKLSYLNAYNVNTIGNKAFSNCISITEIDCPKCIDLGSGAFAHCKSITSVNLPSLCVINNSTFYGCYKLENINIPNVVHIESNAFDVCAALKTFIANNCISCPSAIFYKCDNLRNITMNMCKIFNIRSLPTNIDIINVPNLEVLLYDHIIDDIAELNKIKNKINSNTNYITLKYDSFY